MTKEEINKLFKKLITDRIWIKVKDNHNNYVFSLDIGVKGKRSNIHIRSVSDVDDVDNTKYFLRGICIRKGRIDLARANLMNDDNQAYEVLERIDEVMSSDDYKLEIRDDSLLELLSDDDIKRIIKDTL